MPHPRHTLITGHGNMKLASDHSAVALKFRSRDAQNGLKGAFGKNGKAKHNIHPFKETKGLAVPALMEAVKVKVKAKSKSKKKKFAKKG